LIPRLILHAVARTVAMPLASCALFVAALDAQQFASTPQLAPPPNNVLLIIGDDVGVDMVGCYGEQVDAPPTPTLDALAARGVLFRNTYSQPVCSPTRAGILTGRYGFRVGIGISIEPDLAEYSLPQEEITLPELLNSDKPGTLPCCAIGKWHLGSINNGGPFNPNMQGFAWYSGTLDNFKNGQTYYAHTKVVNGVSIASTTYATTEQVDDALARIQVMPEPWFCYLAFNAPHRPFHKPPPNLHTYSLSGPPMLTPAPHFRAAVQAMDTEIGRLLGSMDRQVLEHTTIIFVGDNGSPPETVLPPFDPAMVKGTLFEGGVNVPLIVAGPNVDAFGVECAAFVNTVDLFPTIGALLGKNVDGALADGRPIDGISMLPYLRDPTHAPLRHWVYADKFDPNGFGPFTSLGRMMRNERWKVITRDGAADLFYDMQGRSLEGPNLDLGSLDSEQQLAYDSLKRELALLLGS
jgi:arylsulfatase A-like enzyme